MTANNNDAAGETLPTFNESNLKTILVCGVSGVGKSRFINTVTGSKLPVGHSTFSETKEITEEGIPMIRMGDKYIQLVDTPGFQDSRDEDEAPVFQNIADWLAKRYEAKFRVTGFIYLRSIQEPRVLRAESGLIKMFKKLCGEDAIDHIVLTTNRWQPPPEKEEEDRESEMINDPTRFGITGSKRVKVQRLNGKYQREDALHVLRIFEDLGPVTLQIQDEMVDKKMSYSQTAAGREIQADLAEKINELTASLKKQQENNSRLQEDSETARKNMELVQERLKAAEGQNESLKQSLQQRLEAAEKENESQKQLMREQLKAIEEQNKAIQAQLKAAEEKNESQKQLMQEQLKALEEQNQAVQAQLKAAEEKNQSLQQSVQERAGKNEFWAGFDRVASGIATLGLTEAFRK